MSVSTNSAGTTLDGTPPTAACEPHLRRTIETAQVISVLRTRLPDPGDPAVLDDEHTARVALHAAGVVHVTARPRNSNRIRTPDLAADILDGFGHPGAQHHIRRHLDADLTRVLPFMLHQNEGEPVTDLVVSQAEHLAITGIEELVTVTRLAGIRLWLVVDEPPSTRPHPSYTALIDHLHLLGPSVSPTQAATYWHQRPAATPPAESCAAVTLHGAATCDHHPSRTQCMLDTGPTLVMADQITSGQLRERLADLRYDPDTSDADLWRLLGAFRDTVRPAATALTEAGHQPDRQSPRDVQPDGSGIATARGQVPLPGGAHVLLARQRTAALIEGQPLDGRLFVINGNPVAAHALTPSCVTVLRPARV